MKKLLFILTVLSVGGLFFFGALTPVSAHSGKCVGADIVLVLDDSGSMRGQKIEDTKNAAKDFADMVFADPMNHQIGLVWFDNSANLAQGLTLDPESVESGINEGDAGGGTRIDLGIQEAHDHFTNTGPHGFKIMIVMSDGSSSGDPISQANQFKNIGGSIYAIAFGSGADQETLKQIATQPNAPYYYYAETGTDLSAIFTSFAGELITLDADGDGAIIAECPVLCKDAPNGCDADDQNQYVHENATEGQCEDGCISPAETWALGDKTYASCRDYYTDDNSNPDPDQCTAQTTATGKIFYTCENYISGAEAINNNQIGGANKAEVSCPKIGGLVPCGRYADDPSTPNIDESKPCDFCAFFVLLQRVLNWIITIIAPLLAIFFVALGGFFVMTSAGRPVVKEKGFKMIRWALLGYVLVLASWLIVNMFFGLIGLQEWTGLTEGWWQITCGK